MPSSDTASRRKGVIADAAAASSGLAGLLRSAGRKSTESLRSVASRRSGKKGDSRPSSRATMASDAPPLPTHIISREGSSTGTPRQGTQSPQPSYDRGEPTPTPGDTADSRHGSSTNLRDYRNASQTSLAKRSARPSSRNSAKRSGSYEMARSGSGGQDGNGDLGALESPAASLRGSGGRRQRTQGRSTASAASALNLDRVQEEPRPKASTGVATGKNGDGNTVAQLYAVFGLPKDPSVWTLAEEDCVAGVHHIDGAVGRFWRPEVLGCSICPSPSEVLAGSKSAVKGKESGASKWEGRGADGKKPQNPKFIEMADGRGGIERAETARVLSKALKLSFTREIEIVSGQANYAPMASSHSFSFSVPTLTSAGDGAQGANGRGAGGAALGGAKTAGGAVGEGFGLEGGPGPTGASTGGGVDETPVTFYGVVLTVWSAADERRARTIKRELTRAAKQKANAAKGKKGWNDGDTAADDGAEDGSEAYSFLPAHNTFFMPYAICIVSRYPLYDLLGDWNKMAWHKYSRNIEMHNQLMSTILRHPAPRLGEQFRIHSPSNDLTFYCVFPGALEWGTGLTGTDFAMWPLFKTLSLDNILTICEIVLGSNGRVLFQSRHPALLGVAVETIRYIVELRGWRGVTNQNCHARDVRIYLEDPGSWIIAINSELRSIVKPPPQVCIVDLDINHVSCPRPPANAPSSKGVRERRKRKLAAGIRISGIEYTPPREFIEAYPGGRFRPLSRIDTSDPNSAYEQLSVPVWWDQTSIVTAFDNALQDTTRLSLFQRLKPKSSKAAAVNEAEMAAILALRRRASTFVDARDGLENKIGRLNKRLAFLMSESEMWKAQFSKIQQLVDRLTKEANDLRSKVDRERRESRRLSSTLAQRDMEQVQLQIQLKETEQAREAAQAELSKMQRAMDALEHEREAMMDEIRNVVSGAGDDVTSSILRLDAYSEAHVSRSGSPNGSMMSHTPSQLAESIMRHRTAAEARISEGRPGRAPSSNANHGGSSRRSLSHDRAERERRSDAASSAHHFPDEQMNQEIQARTSVVTDQIARIQQQLESTLTNLEGRRSGTFERGRDREGRRDRRLSSSSISSLRHEYGLPSSLGHGMDNGSEYLAAPSSVGGHGGGGGGYASSAAEDNSDYESADNSSRPVTLKGRKASQLNGLRNMATPPSTSSGRRALSAAGSSSSVAKSATQPQARPRERENPWKDVSKGPKSPGAVSAISSTGEHSPVTPTSVIVAPASNGVGEGEAVKVIPSSMNAVKAAAAARAGAGVEGKTATAASDAATQDVQPAEVDAEADADAFEDAEDK